MASKNSIRMVVSAGLALAAGVAFAAVSENFEDDDYSGTWSGGTPTAEETTPPLVGSPIAGAAHTKYYAVVGEATCAKTTDTSTNFSKADFLVKVTEGADAELVDAPTTTTTTSGTLQIAVAAGQESNNEIPLAIYCTGKGESATAGWVTTSAKFSKGTWQRLTLVFDYVNDTCQVNLDGVPVVSSSGYLTSDKSGEGNGSWYLINGKTQADVSGLAFVGVASIDDVVVEKLETATSGRGYDSKVTQALAVETGADATVPVEKLSQWGVTSLDKSIDASGLTIAQELAMGVEPGEGPEGGFKASKMALSSSGVPTITFPGGTSEKYGVTPTFKAEVNGKEYNLSPSGENGTLTAAIPSEAFTSDNVHIIKIKAVGTNAASGN